MILIDFYLCFIYVLFIFNPKYSLFAFFFFVSIFWLSTKNMQVFSSNPVCLESSNDGDQTAETIINNIMRDNKKSWCWSISLKHRFIIIIVRFCWICMIWNNWMVNSKMLWMVGLLILILFLSHFMDGIFYMD